MALVVVAAAEAAIAVVVEEPSPSAAEPNVMAVRHEPVQI